MKKPIVDYREFRLSRLNEPQFSHLKLLLGWVGYFVLYFLTENLIPAENCTPVHMWLDDVIPFCEWFIFPYMSWHVSLLWMSLYTLAYDLPAFKRFMYNLILTTMTFEFNYTVDGNNVSIDFVDERASDAKYEFVIDNDLLMLTGGPADSQGQHILKRDK